VFWATPFVDNVSHAKVAARAAASGRICATKGVLALEPSRGACCVCFALGALLEGAHGRARYFVAATKGEVTMDPSYVRKRILQEHRGLRAELRELEDAVDAMSRDPSQVNAVGQRARELLAHLVTHTQLEDSILAPALRDIDAWGPVRASMLLDHHSEQRAQLREIVESYATIGDPERIARMTLTWMREVRADMAHEESDLLTTTLLRDDPIAINMEAG
jgi:hypothetical protein